MTLPQIEQSQNSPIEEEITPIPEEEIERLPTDNVSTIDTIYDRNRASNPVAPIQPVEPVIGFTPEEKKKAKEDPKLTVKEILGLMS